MFSWYRELEMEVKCIFSLALLAVFQNPVLVFATAHLKQALCVGWSFFLEVIKGNKGLWNAFLKARCSVGASEILMNVSTCSLQRRSRWGLMHITWGIWPDQTHLAHLNAELHPWCFPGLGISIQISLTSLAQQWRSWCKSSWFWPWMRPPEHCWLHRQSWDGECYSCCSWKAWWCPWK